MNALSNPIPPEASLFFKYSMHDLVLSRQRKPVDYAPISPIFEFIVLTWARMAVSIPFLVAIFLCSSTTLISGGRHVKYVKYKDPRLPVEVRVQDLLKRMTLAEKIGQMTQIEGANATKKVMKKYFIGIVHI